MKRSFTLTIFVWVLVLVLGTFQAVANGANPRLFDHKGAGISERCL